MRIVAGAWRGRPLQAPPGSNTRPTADRVRQALFDILIHAPWGGREAVSGARVLDAFAGSGALGLEALSRGAGHATFIERGPSALAALRANIVACGAAGATTILASDVTTAPPGDTCSLVFLDPPYGQELVPRAVTRLRERGWIGPGSLLVAEVGRTEPLNVGSPLSERAHGAARLVIWREE